MPDPEVKTGLLAKLNSTQSLWITVLVVVVPALVAVYWDSQARSMDLEERQAELDAKKTVLDEDLEDLEGKAVKFEKQALATTEDVGAAIEELRSEAQLLADAMIGDIADLQSRVRALEPCCMEDEDFIRTRAQDILKVDVSGMDLGFLRDIVHAVEGKPELKATKAAKRAKADKVEIKRADPIYAPKE